MARCEVCGAEVRRGSLTARPALPEYRSMIGFWPWLDRQVCPACRPRHDRDLKERILLLAPEVIENDEPIVRRVCVACGAAEEDADAWHQAAKWLDAEGRPVRRCTFYLCGEHARTPYAEGVVVSSNLDEPGAMAALVAELPAISPVIVARAEGWTPGTDAGPPDGADFTPDLSEAEAAEAALRWWRGTAEGLEARGAWLGPVRRDYRLRYRLDLARDFPDGRRETLVVLRTAPDRLATYRLTGKAVVGHRLA